MDACIGLAGGSAKERPMANESTKSNTAPFIVEAKLNACKAVRAVPVVKTLTSKINAKP
jgi:hypothetical protein